MLKIAPSILAADLLQLGNEVKRMMDAGCDMIHVDVMDGHFVPNLSFGPGIVQQLHQAFPELRLDVHLMLEHPQRYLEVFAPYAWNVTVHSEIADPVDDVLREIHALGARAGLSLKPATSVEAIEHLLGQTDMVLIMTVEPGFGGQPFRFEMLEKIRRLARSGYPGLIEADGGIRMSNLQQLVDAGLNVAVMGTGLFRSADAKAEMRAIHALESREER